MALVQRQHERDKLKRNIFTFRENINRHINLSKKYSYDDEGFKQFSRFEVHFTQYNQDIDHVIELINNGKSQADVISYLTNPVFIENFKAADDALSAIAHQKSCQQN